MKENYRPASDLLLLFKVFEGCVYKQIYDIMIIYCQNIKRVSKKDIVVIMLKKNGEKGNCGARFEDLFKAFDTLPQDLLLATIRAIGFDHQSLRLKFNFLREGRFNTRSNFSYSLWKDLLYHNVQH